MVGVIARATVPTVTESIAGANFSGDPSCRPLFIFASTPLYKARMFGIKHSDLSLSPGAPASSAPGQRAGKSSEVNWQNAS